MKKYLVIDIIVAICMGVLILLGEDSFLAITLFITLISLAIFIVFYMKIRKKINQKIKTIEQLMDSGNYKVYLDGQLIDDPQGIDISMYKIKINHKKKIIKFTTIRQNIIYY